MNEIINKKHIAIACVIAIVVAVCCVCRQSNDNRRGTGDAANGIKAARSAINQGTNQQSKITNGIRVAEGTAQNLQREIGTADQSAGRIEAEIADQREALAECRASVRRCQQVLNNIQARNAETTKTP